MSSGQGPETSNGISKVEDGPDRGRSIRFQHISPPPSTVVLLPPPPPSSPISLSPGHSMAAATLSIHPRRMSTPQGNLLTLPPQQTQRTSNSSQRASLTSSTLNPANQRRLSAGIQGTSASQTNDRLSWSQGNAASQSTQPANRTSTSSAQASASASNAIQGQSSSPRHSTGSQGGIAWYGPTSKTHRTAGSRPPPLPAAYQYLPAGRRSYVMADDLQDRSTRFRQSTAGESLARFGHRFSSAAPRANWPYNPYASRPSQSFGRMGTSLAGQRLSSPDVAGYTAAFMGPPLPPIPDLPQFFMAFMVFLFLVFTLAFVTISILLYHIG